MWVLIGWTRKTAWSTTSLTGQTTIFLQGAIAYSISTRKKEGLVRFTGLTSSWHLQDSVGVDYEFHKDDVLLARVLIRTKEPHVYW